MPNLLPEIAEEDKRILETFAASGSAEAAVLTRVFKTYLEHFRDIRNIDPQGANVGLQACSHFRAYDMLEEIFRTVAPEKRQPEERKSNSYR